MSLFHVLTFCPFPRLELECLIWYVYKIECLIWYVYKMFLNWSVVLQNMFWAETEEKTMAWILNDFILPNRSVYITILCFTGNEIKRIVNNCFHSWRKKVNQSHWRPEVPRGFQEFKVPRIRDNGPGWW